MDCQPTDNVLIDAPGRTTPASSSDSQDEYDNHFDQSFATTPGIYDPYTMSIYPVPNAPFEHAFPYEVDVKTERQMFVNDVPTRRDSTISTFSTFIPPPPHAMLPSSFVGEEWMAPELHQVKTENWGNEEDLDFNFFQFSHGHQPEQAQSNMIPVDDCDTELFNHLLENVLPLMFPILEANQHGSVKADLILPALENNQAYLHSCLSAAAVHTKATNLFPPESIDSDIVRHKYAFVNEVVQALTHDINHVEILEATLGMIALQCCVGKSEEQEKDIPWHQHFQAATELVNKLNLPQTLEDMTHTRSHPPFNMTLTAWIDILGSTMLGRAPSFANTYRNKHLSASTSGLAELMGCQDNVMYLLSEIACLDSLKMDNKLDAIGICSHITSLAQQLDATEDPSEILQMPYSRSGAIRPRQLSRNITAIFRKATRIYLCSLVPNHNRYDAATSNLVAQMADMLQYIPTGPTGFDRSVVWPMLICGANSIPNSPFRRVLAERIEALGVEADHGSFGRMVRVLHEVWRRNDETTFSAGVCEATPVTTGSPGGSITTPIISGISSNTGNVSKNQNVHWRDVMLQNGWDYLLI